VPFLPYRVARKSSITLQFQISHLSCCVQISKESLHTHTHTHICFQDLVAPVTKKTDLSPKINHPNDERGRAVDFVLLQDGTYELRLHEKKNPVTDPKVNAVAV
jgi:hypothetical protein